MQPDTLKKFSEEKSQYLRKLDVLEQHIETLARKANAINTTCSLTCKICQCLECAKIPGGDV